MFLYSSSIRGWIKKTKKPTEIWFDASYPLIHYSWKSVSTFTISFNPHGSPQSGQPIYSLLSFFLVENGSDDVQAFYTLGWKFTMSWHGSEFRVVTSPASGVRLEDISVSRAVGTTAHHLFQNMLLFPWEFWVDPWILHSLPTEPASFGDLHYPCSSHGLLAVSACSCQLAIFLLVWTEDQRHSWRHLLSGCSGAFSRVFCQGAHTDSHGCRVLSWQPRP